MRSLRNLEILEPESIDEAVQILSAHGDEAKVLAGGTAVVLMYAQRLIFPQYLVSLASISDLNYIRHESGVGLRLGAMTTHHEIENSPLVRTKFPVVAEVFHQVANIRVRNQATVGGVIAEADYASDPPAVFVSLGAQVRVTGPNGERIVPIAKLIRGFYETSLAENEIITEVIVPDMAASSHATYIKFVTRSSEDRPCVGVAVVIRGGSGTICEEANVVIGAVASKPQKLPEVEALARGEYITEELAREIGRGYAAGITPISDMRGSDWYRKQVIEVLVRRAILQAAGGQA